MGHPENFFGYDADDDRWQIAELSVLINVIDRQQEQLERLVDADPVGAVWFSDDDAWWDKRLGRNAPQE
jgi:hypothetical protein